MSPDFKLISVEAKTIIDQSLWSKRQEPKAEIKGEAIKRPGAVALAESEPRESESYRTQPAKTEPQPPLAGKLYQGNIRLAIAPPTSQEQIVSLWRHLQKCPGIGVREINASTTGVSIITIFLKEAIDLAGVLKSMAIVEVNSDRSLTAEAGNALQLRVRLADSKPGQPEDLKLNDSDKDSPLAYYTAA